MTASPGIARPANSTTARLADKEAVTSGAMPPDAFAGQDPAHDGITGTRPKAETKRASRQGPPGRESRPGTASGAAAISTSIKIESIVQEPSDHLVRCIRCGAPLTARRSVEVEMGPVCRLLVARSVEKKESAHRPVSIETGAKVSARQFGEEPGTSAKRVPTHVERMAS